MNFEIKSPDGLSKSIRKMGISDWKMLTDYIRELPYGRNANRKDFTLVWSEKKGTCSSKHAFLKHIADSNNQSTVKLILAIYKMNGANTQGISHILKINKLAYIPEAHCFLSINGKDFDFTSVNSDMEKISPDIVYREEIKPDHVASYKVILHQKFMQKLILENELPFTFEKIWKIRETCIKTLSQREC